MLQLVNNDFKVKQKVEAVMSLYDARLIGVATIIDVNKFTITLHFDDYEHRYDVTIAKKALHDKVFWKGFCDAIGLVLQKPINCTEVSFNWDAYLASTKSEATPESVWHGLGYKSASDMLNFRTGQYLEAKERIDPTKIRVAHIGRISPNQSMEIIFDGLEPEYNFVLSMQDMENTIFPIGYAAMHELPLLGPRDNFEWFSFLHENKVEAVNENVWTVRIALRNSSFNSCTN